MESLLDRWSQKAAANADTPEEDRGYHRLLYSGLRNSSLSWLIDIFWLVYHAMPREDLGPDWHPAGTVAAHRELLVAVRSRDAILTQQKMRAHFANLEKWIADVGEKAAHATTAPAV